MTKHLETRTLAPKLMRLFPKLDEIEMIFILKTCKLQQKMVADRKAKRFAATISFSRAGTMIMRSWRSALAAAVLQSATAALLSSIRLSTDARGGYHQSGKAWEEC
ncbi:hypothetical protein [Rhizobium laguerreae]|uniref:hypothetical protein n=1 Tax=Rhizobium laguerreae TaxID=1076926 RepID=UPI001C910209|nr:hypothetical protein [Rhizobium laguerreae]MBY3349119.1 hypothetical protein [Rhizobium laguerreae]MBY3356130.1 hypothetical protein [Rhizobium laguerreae]MBY3370253.1 hypothetical protein [Rhizobium laguerreae]MBY3377262.1 hypothetical protein [Rhizobium laguerreae]MBY3391014.1 hypothetical protein [Rhizobium laguerreae]